MESEGESARGGFKKETVNKLLHLYFKDDKTRVSGDALLLMVEMLKVFVRALSFALNSLDPCVTEAAARGARQAETEDLTKVDVEHVEKVLPQLLLDF
nr:centromere protein X isoform X1 [Anolis sagrei ordinatus]